MENGKFSTIVHSCCHINLSLGMSFVRAIKKVAVNHFHRQVVLDLTLSKNKMPHRLAGVEVVVSAVPISFQSRGNQRSTIRTNKVRSDSIFA
jgi:hypothetical protein